MASVYAAEGQEKEYVQKQKELLERILLAQEEKYGKDHYEVAIILIKLGSTYAILGNVRKQKELFERAYIIALNYPDCGANHPITLKIILKH